MTEQNVEKKKRPRLLTKYPLPSNDLSFEKHLDILKAYVVSSKEGKEPVSYNNFKTLVDVNPLKISNNNKFFENIGLIKNIDRSKGTYIPQEATLRLYNALKWDKKEEISKILKETLTDSWFWNSAKQLVELKGFVSKKELKDKIGYDVSADPKKHNNALSILIDYLLYAELLKEEDGKISFKIISKKPPVDQHDTNAGPMILAKKEDLSKNENKNIPCQPSNIMIGILINPEMSEEQIRKVIRIVKEELSK